MNYQDLLPSLRTGDLVLSSGCSWFANIIKQITGCSFSHAGMVVLGKDLDLKEQVYVWEATGKGIIESPWKEATHTKYTDFLAKTINPGAGNVIVRQLSPEISPSMLYAFRLHRAEVRGRHYEQNKTEMLKACFPNLAEYIGRANRQDLSTIFCWECVAAAYQAMDLLSIEKPANTYPIHDFLEGGGMTLRYGYTLGPEIKVEGL